MIVRPRGDDALHRRGAARPRRAAPSAICVSLERSMKCARRPLRALPARPAVRLQGRAGAAPRRASSRCMAGARAVSAEPHARRVEVRLLRRLPAHRCSTARTSCSRSPARSRSPTSSRPAARRVEGPYDLSLVEGSITTAARRRAHPRDPRALAAAGHDRRLRDRRRHPGAAQLRRRRRLRRRSSTPARSTSRRCATRRRSSAHVRGRLRAAAAARSTSASCSRSSAPTSTSAGRAIAAHSVCIECKRARQRLRDGRPRHAVPRARSRTPAAARCARPTTAAATAASGRWRTPNAGSLGALAGRPRRRASATSCALYRTFYADAPAVPRRERGAR